MNVLSLFDGMSCGRIALERANIKVENYYASELDTYAIKVAQANWPETIQLGDVSKWKEWAIDWSSIDLLIGGSPCQGFSFAGKHLAFDDPRSALFFEYVNILNHIKAINPNVKFLLENVKMKQEHLDIISEMVGVEPVVINSSLVTGMLRCRYYWANWAITQPEDINISAQSLLETDEARVDKFPTLTATYYKGGGEATRQRNFKKSQRPIAWIDDTHTRHLTPIECERLQTVTENYTKHVSKTQRYRMLGNGWTVDVIVHIFKGLNKMTEPASDLPRILLLDFETRSRLSITNPEYTSHESTKILCMAYGFRDPNDKGTLWWPGDKLRPEVVSHIKDGGLIGASNARFDREIWQFVGEDDHKFPATFNEQWFCTQAQSRVAGLPSALEKGARALGLKQRKSAAGSRLIAKCCVPPFSKDPQDYADLGVYCLQDFIVMRDTSLAIPMLNDYQLEDYQFNEDVNDRGIKVDVEMAEAATQYAEAERAEINAELIKITDGTVTACTQHKRICTWLRGQLEDYPEVLKLMRKHKRDKDTKLDVVKWSSDKNVRINLSAGHEDGSFTLPFEVLKLLECMEDAGGSAVSKFSRMVQKADPVDGRVRGILRYAGAASTLRYSSMGLQIHNFRRDAFDLKTAMHVRELMMQFKELTDLQNNVLPVMDTLGRLLRTAIIPEDGNVLVVGDWNAVESRMTAWLSGDKAKIDLFKRGDDPYCYEASGIYGRTITKEDAKERQIGKITDLACGFMGGVGALASMAAQFRVFIEPEKMQEIVDSYRRNHPKIVDYSDQLMGAAIRAVMEPGTIQKVKHTAYIFNPVDRALYCQLTGGMNMIRYPEARIEMNPVPWSETETRPQLTALKAAFTPAADSKEWARHGIWRGICIENIAQGNCAQLLREKCLDCDDAGLNVIFHVHDEIILEVPADQALAARDKLKEIMETTPHWLKGLPLVAEPKIMARYGK